MIMVTVALAAAMAEAAELPRVTPESVGMSSDRLQRITEHAQAHVDSNEIPGIVTIVARHGKVAFVSVVGHRGADDIRRLREDALYRIYSMTKPITAVAALILFEEGRFQLSDPVASVLPELEQMTVWGETEPPPDSGRPTIHHLLTHTGGFGYGFFADGGVESKYRERELLRRPRDLDDFVEEVGQLPLATQAGWAWRYSVSSDLLGAVVQRVSGKRLDEFLQASLFDPLDMKDTFFNVPTKKRERLLPNHIWDAQTSALVTLDKDCGHPVLCLNYDDTELFLGGIGLVSTARDYMRFAEMLRNGGELDGRRVLSPRSVAFMSSDHLPAVLDSTVLNRPQIFGRAGLGYGFGVQVVTDPIAFAIPTSRGEYGWGGAAGTVFWIDPIEEIVVVSMMQRYLIGVPGWRDRLRVLVYQAIIESVEK
jgi:CubicO group peptidase (beta-lactamase class C family)